MQFHEEEIDLEKALWSCRVKHHDVSFTRASKPAPERANLPQRAPRQQEVHAEGGDGGLGEMDAEPTGGGPGLETETIDLDAEEKDKNRTQTTRNDGVGVWWGLARDELVDEMLAAAAENEEFEEVQKAAERITYQMLLDKRLSSLVCPRCDSADLERNRGVKVHILTHTAVHTVLMPIYTCKR